MALTAECVQCGYCCTVGVCPYGAWNVTENRCVYLSKSNSCEKYEEILRKPGSHISPAFGEGCSSSIFNSLRNEKIRQLSNPSA